MFPENPRNWPVRSLVEEKEDHCVELALPPLECALGALLNHLRTPVKHFQPSNAHFGLMPELDEKAKKKDRKALYSARARERFAAWRAEQGL